ncbi:unnamed protein product [Dicrocoelium dendriticum]|nr:unnamed protein product [Dicrocoelium dendriticum]
MMKKPLCALALLSGIASALPIGLHPSSDTQSCHRTYAFSNNGTIQERELFGESRFCNYDISVDSKRQIELKFKKARLKSLDVAYLDYVLVFDGPNCMLTRVGAVSGGDTPTFTSSRNKMTALFIREYARSTFKATYSAVNKRNATETTPPSDINRILDNCGGERNGPNGTISFKGDRMANNLCIWRLKVGKGKKVHLQLRAKQSKALGSLIRILDGGDCAARELARITVQNKSQTYKEISTSNMMMVVFSSVVGSPTEEVQVLFWDGKWCMR